jgi:hypothetical protein
MHGKSFVFKHSSTTRPVIVGQFDPLMEGGLGRNDTRLTRFNQKAAADATTGRLA